MTFEEAKAFCYGPEAMEAHRRALAVEREMERDYRESAGRLAMARKAVAEAQDQLTALVEPGQPFQPVQIVIAARTLCGTLDRFWVAEEGAL